MNDKQRMQRLQALFHEMVDLPEDRKPAFLAEHCAEDPELRAELEALVALDQSQTKIDKAIVDCVEPVARQLPEQQPQIPEDSRIGGYRLLREIGSGGMGSVFLAEREDEEFQHRVAIKLVRGFPSAPMLERFRRERELLAALRHPNIARLFDGGTTPAGQPYLVMEYVEGISLDEWCRQNKPSLRQRLVLFQALCSALQHAHQKLIIHRDLKPANILVRNKGQPVLLDFGIGKLLDQKPERDLTAQVRSFTPAYASPEQLRGEPATTLSDVYGLGLILFELLTGSPLRRDESNTSTRLPSKLAADSIDWMRSDARRLRGDLDNITRKALHDEPGRRYPSATALAADIQAWFDGRPVMAAPDAWHYRLRKFITRHPFAIGSTAATILLLTVLSIQLASERTQARLEAESAIQSAVFLVELLKASSPESTRGEELTVRALLEQAEQDLQTRQFGRPLVKARLEAALGEIYYSLGLYSPSIELLERAQSHAVDDAGNDGVLARIMTRLAMSYYNAGRLDEARAVALEALQINRRVQPDGHPDIAHSLMSLGVAEQELGQDENARDHFQQALEIFTAAGDDYRDNQAAALHNLGWSAFISRRYDAARELLLRALEIKTEVIGERHPSTFNTVHMLSMVENRLGNHETALLHNIGLLANKLEVIGEPNQSVALTYNEMASTLHDLGRYSEAAANYQSAIDQYERLGQVSNPAYAVPINNSAVLLEAQEYFDQAEQRLRLALGLRIAFNSQPSALARGYHNLARTLLATGKLDEARETVAQAWAIRGDFEPAHHPARVDSVLLQALIELRQGNRAAAEAWLDEYRDLSQQARLPSTQLARGHETIAEFARADGDLDRALAEQRSALEIIAQVLPEPHPVRARLQLAVASLLADRSNEERAQGRELFSEAEPLIVAEFAADGPTRHTLNTLRARLEQAE